MNELKSFYGKRIIELELVISVSMAFCGAYLSMFDFGFIATLPILLIFAVAGGFLNQKKWLTLLIYSIVIVTICAVFLDGVDFYYVAASLIIVSGLGIFSVSFFKSKTTAKVILGIFMLVLALASQAFALGNIFSFTKAASAINEYKENNYRQSTIIIEKTRYSNDLGLYVSRIYDIGMPGDIHEIVYTKNGTIIDGYKTISEKEIINRHQSNMTDVFNKFFPNDTLKVTSSSIVGYPNFGVIDRYDSADYYGHLRFEIFVGGMMQRDELREKAEDYYLTLLENEIAVESITFTAGSYATPYIGIKVSGVIPELLSFTDVPVARVGADNIIVLNTALNLVLQYSDHFDD